MTKTDDLMALAEKYQCSESPLKSARELCTAIEQALLQAHKEGFDAALLPGSVPDAQRQGRLLDKPPSPQRLPLTDEEIEYIKDQYLEYNGLDEFDRYTYTTERADGVLDFARAVLEAAHGIGSTK